MFHILCFFFKFYIGFGQTNMSPRIKRFFVLFDFPLLTVTSAKKYIFQIEFLKLLSASPLLSLLHLFHCFTNDERNLFNFFLKEYLIPDTEQKAPTILASSDLFKC